MIDRPGWRRHGAALAAVAVLVSACTGGDDSAGDRSSTEASGDGSPDQIEVTVNGVPVDANVGSAPAAIGLRLSEGSASNRTAAAVPLVAGDPLDAQQLSAVIDRLPAWEPPAAQVEPFNRPPETLQPPLIGDTVETPFPPSGAAAPVGDPDAGPLRVVRFQPEGEVGVAPYFTVTFNQPMVPVATLDQLDAAAVPVTMSPAITGRWRWIGTRTLRFEVAPGATDRLPAATEYRVEVPAGTRSADGSTLADAVSFAFSTPAPTVVQLVGIGESMPLEPVFVAVFDQRVDADAVIPTIAVTVDGSPVAVRRATTAEVDADDAARAAITSTLDARAVAFVTDDPLPADASVRVQIGPGTPSAEGPRTATAVAEYSGRTYGRFRIVRATCDWGAGCTPGVPFTIEFSNAIDPAGFAADLVAVTPAIAGMRISVYGNAVEISGATRGRTTYRVTFAADLADSFGQTLGEPSEQTFDVGPASPAFQGVAGDWITVDPFAARPTVSVRTINHDDIRVRAWAVTPGDTIGFRDYLEAHWQQTEPPLPDWPLVLDATVPVEGDEDMYVETQVDLSEAFAEAGTQIVVRVEPTRPFAPEDAQYWANRPTVTWVQRTTLGVDAFVDSDELAIWTTDLTTGLPVPGVDVELIGDGRSVTTDASGVARIELTGAEVRGLWATAGETTALLPGEWYGGWRRQDLADEGRWYVFDDRGIYRPGETVRLTGWVRRLAWSDEARLLRYAGDVDLRYTAWDPQGVELASGTLALNPLGGFNVAIELPAGANLGVANIELSLGGLPADQYASWNHSFQIQEFRRPEFEVSARAESTGPYFAAAPATVAVDAAYFAGGPLPDAQVDWIVSTSQTTYRPPRWDQYTFGVWQPWWIADGFAGGFAAGGRGFGGPAFESDIGPCVGCGTEYEQYSGRTDASGTHYLQVEFEAPDVDLPTVVTAEATVYDVNRQAWASRTDLLVHPARAYVGLRSDRTFVEQGTPIRYDVVVTDVDGNVVAGRPVTVTAARLDWNYVAGVWTEQPTDEQHCSLTSGDPGDAAMRCEFATTVGGTYQVTAIVDDDTGRRNRTVTTMWVSGGEARPVRSVEQQQVTIIPSAEHYAPGDTAELLVQAPFAPATGLLTLVRGGIVATIPFEAPDGSAVLQIPITDEHVPNLTAQVDVVGLAPRAGDDGTPVPEAPPRPAFATSRIELLVPPITRALTVEATPASDTLEPGGTTTVGVRVTRADGSAAAGAEVAVVVVDEAVLALTGYTLGDPLDQFYLPLWANLQTKYLRGSIRLDRADLLGAAPVDETEQPVAEEAAPDAAGATAATAPAEQATSFDAAAEGGLARSSANAKAGGEIELRTDFSALAVYAPGAVAGPDGTVTIDVPLPDSLTRYRVMAVAVDGDDRFGKGESTITARLALMARPAAPRFLNFGDRFELPVVIQNQTETEMTVDVVVEAGNLLVGGGTDQLAGRRVSVPANDRIEVRIPAAADQVGNAGIRVAAVQVDGPAGDATELTLPVYTPATSEAFATYGVIDGDAAIAQPVAAPEGVLPQFGGLEIGTSSTALQALTDAVIYLHEYRYDTPDGYASRIMAIAALRDVLTAFESTQLPAAEVLDSRVQSDISGLVALQNDDGGWGWWTRGLTSIPWQSMQATHALVVADAAGYVVPDEPLRRALQFAADVESYIPATYAAAERSAVRAYAIHVRTLAGDRDPAKAAAVYADGGADLQLDAIAWLWPSIDDVQVVAGIERLFASRVAETASAATFATSYGEQAFVVAHSDRRTDAVILAALIGEQPESDLIPKVVAGLLGSQIRGRWNSAQDNAFVLLALERYFDTFESVTPDFVARAWLGERYVAEHAFRGRSADRAATLVPIAELIGTDGAPLVLQRDGEGRMYYRLGLRYAPADFDLDARDQGFVVQRSYEAVDDPADVLRNPDGTWTIRAGATLRVRLTLVADARRTHVALVDALPAGLEPLNPALAASQTVIPESPERPAPAPRPWDWCWCWNWFEHQNLRDDRVEVFSSWIDGGTYEYTYVARATTPGEFVVPPAMAEELFAPEVFGRSGSDRVAVVSG